MTRRERLEARLSKRGDWADGRRRKAEAVTKETEKYRGDIAFNTQPGHIPERARLIRREERAFEDLKMAKHHEQKASGIANQLNRSIFSDDTDAIAVLEARIAEREVEAERSVAVNKAWRKSKGTPAERAAALVAAGACGPKLAETVAQTMALCPWLKSPLDTTNLRASIRRDRERIAEIERRAAKTSAAASAGGVLIETSGGWAQVTFAEKPERGVLEALCAAGFRWGSGRWSGPADRVADLMPLIQCTRRAGSAQAPTAVDDARKEIP